MRIVTAVRNWDSQGPDAVGVPQSTSTTVYDLQSIATNAFYQTVVTQQTNTDVNFAETTYVSDRLGRISQMRDVALSNGDWNDDIDDKLIDLSYDAAGRMTSVERSSLGGAFLFDTDYSYDDAGRLDLSPEPEL